MYFLKLIIAALGIACVCFIVWAIIRSAIEIIKRGGTMRTCGQCKNCAEDADYCELLNEPLNENDEQAETCRDFEEQK